MKKSLGLREALGSGVRPIGTGIGVAPYGPLHDDLGVKGQGYFGPLKASQGYSTEIGAADEQGGYPLMVPTLNRGELDHLLSGAEPTDEIYEKAQSWANYRRARGQSPFAERQGLRAPLPLE